MANVLFSSGQRRYTGGEERVRIDAATVRELFSALRERYPLLGETLDSMAIAIDGEIVNEPLLERLSPDAEVHFLPPIGGGSRGAAGGGSRGAAGGGSRGAAGGGSRGAAGADPGGTGESSR